ncbi:hypothetical protein AVEN_92849-1 [Araneus ventricosus]|uniref:Uncharacterized protein n=1 Tax=Araneus ventricosus TaxID=182803 RepID=A0A4Y2N9H1_ARAVE|nr:hypothetical protein AVEN_92849-1 [Araneus ventricosus]
MYEHLLSLEYERAMKLQKKILTASDASKPTFSARSTRFLSTVHISADESDQDSLQLVKSKETRKKRCSSLRSDISKRKFKILPLELKNQRDSLV